MCTYRMNRNTFQVAPGKLDVVENIKVIYFILFFFFSPQIKCILKLAIVSSYKHIDMLLNLFIGVHTYRIAFCNTYTILKKKKLWLKRDPFLFPYIGNKNFIIHDQIMLSVFEISITKFQRNWEKNQEKLFNCSPDKSNNKQTNK